MAQDNNNIHENEGLILITGPSRGGKSQWAEHLLSHKESVTYIATAASNPDDISWQQRIKLHRERRPDHWHLIESGAELIEAIESTLNSEVILIDSLGGFVAHHLDRQHIDWGKIENALLQLLICRQATTAIVIEETGWGVVPTTEIGGLFRDRLGSLAQKLEKIANNSWLVIQGRALNLHELGLPVP